VLAARQNFQAQASKFNITGIHSETTSIAATKWPSSGAWTVAELSTFEPSPNVEISATVHAPLLCHIVAAMLVASE